MARLRTPFGLAVLLVLRSLSAQEPDERHYRWLAKVDTSLAGAAAIPASVTDMLAGWAPLKLTARDADAPRRGRELQVYQVTGWVRRVHQNPDDDDLHLELTAGPASPRDSCIVAEIPDPRAGSVYGQARADLERLLGRPKFRSKGRLRVPVLLQVIGAAFFDGKHQKRVPGATGKKSTRPTYAEGHRDCHASPSALWEMHPVYRVARP
jgi:hypothetical protein